MVDDDRMLRREEVEAFVGLSSSAIYRMMRRDEFPLPVKIGRKAVRWKRSELVEFLDRCPRASGEAA